MQNFNLTIEHFLSLVKCFDGSTPTFRINYKKEQIEILYAPSGFLRMVFTNDRVLASLDINGFISFQMFNENI